MIKNRVALGKSYRFDTPEDKLQKFAYSLGIFCDRNFLLPKLVLVIPALSKTPHPADGIHSPRDGGGLAPESAAFPTEASPTETTALES
jgi:hypothetical protein